MAPEKATGTRSLSTQPNHTLKPEADRNGKGKGKVNGSSSSSAVAAGGPPHTNDPRTFDLKPAKELSDILGTGLTEEELSLCVQLIQDGIPPHMLAEFVKRSRDSTSR